MANSTLTLPQNLHSFYQKRLLESAEKNLKLLQFGNQVVQPKGSGKEYQKLRYGNLNDAVQTLTEGVVPPESTLATDKQSIFIDEIGEWIKVTELLKKTAIDDVMTNHMDRFGEKAARSIDTIIRDTLIADATNIKYVDPSYTIDNDVLVTDTFTARSVIPAVKDLRGQNASEQDDGSFAWIVHPFVSMDMLADTAAGGVIELNKYVQGLANKPLNGEVGKVYGARIIDSTNISSVDNAGVVPVYRTFVMAKDAYCLTKFDDSVFKLVMKDIGSAGTADPLNQFGSVGFKAQFGVKYLGGSFVDDNGASPDTVIQVRGTATA